MVAIKADLICQGNNLSSECGKWKLIGMKNKFRRYLQGTTLMYDSVPKDLRMAGTIHQYKNIRFFSNLVGEVGPRIPGVKDSSGCFIEI